MFTLPIKKQWFDMILDRVKKEEYREITGYYIRRFRNLYGCRELDEMTDGRTAFIALRNGYRADSPTIYIKASVSIGEGREEWGAKPGAEYFVLHIIEVYTKNPIVARVFKMPNVSEKARQGVLDFIRECRADWVHDPSVGLYGPTEEETVLLNAIENALQGDESTP